MTAPVMEAGVARPTSAPPLDIPSLLAGVRKKNRRLRRRAWYFMLPLILVNGLVIVAAHVGGHLLRLH